jgi:hypothetical protein
MLPNQDKDINSNRHNADSRDDDTATESIYRSNTISAPEISTRLYNRNPISKYARECLYCGNIGELVWVHGHGQCARCGINIDECCRGEQCETE